MPPAPIALFAYNRPDHLRRTVDALLANDLAADTKVYVFSDGPKTPAQVMPVARVRAFLAEIKGFKSLQVIDSATNRGLAGSIIAGVTQMCAEHGRVIVVEDDLVTSPYFLQYMNEALDLYERQREVISIHGYVYPVTQPLPESFFLRGADCWGWATWQRGWSLFNPDGRALLAELESRQLTHDFDFDGTTVYTEMLRGQIKGTNDSWAVRWYASAFLKNKLTLYPGRSLVHNIGNDGTGVHASGTAQYDSLLAHSPLKLTPLAPVENVQAREAVSTYFKSLQPLASRRPWQRLKRWLNAGEAV